MFGKQKQPQVNGCILAYTYETVDDIVNTYVVAQDEERIYRMMNGKYYLCILGDKTYYKLECKGYLPIERVYQKYGVTEIPIVEDIEHKNGFMKTLLYRGRH